MRTNQRLKRAMGKLLVGGVIAMISGRGAEWNRRDVGFGAGNCVRRKADFGREMLVAKMRRRVR